MKYRVRDGRRSSGNVKTGDFVYKATFHDYGCASEDTQDTQDTGVYHISVSLKEDGDYPFFTIPEEDLEIDNEATVS